MPSTVTEVAERWLVRNFKGDDEMQCELLDVFYMPHPLNEIRRLCPLIRPTLFFIRDCVSHQKPGYLSLISNLQGYFIPTNIFRYWSVLSACPESK